ncbi:MAG: response regulator transcription factor [Terriglobales bacterium]
MSPIRIVLVDDHEVARRALRSVVRANPDIEVVGEAVEGKEALKKVEELRPDIVLLDISLPDMSGIEVAPGIRAVSPESRIIFVSQHISIPLAKDALRGGAYGYVVKSDAGLDLLAAIEAAHEGRSFVSRTLHGRGWT